jgi:hypothetical protein
MNPPVVLRMAPVTVKGEAGAVVPMPNLQAGFAAVPAFHW